MIEISQQQKGEIMEHANKAYEHVGKMIDCLEECCADKMNMRDDDEWYIRRYNGERYNGDDHCRPYRSSYRMPRYREPWMY